MSDAIEIMRRIGEQKREIASVPKLELRSPLNSSRRIPELDGLRGVAIGMVVFYHYVGSAIVARPPELLGYLWATTRLLWSGVDLFFVLSGFLISGILLDARNSPNYFATFYIRRFCRILPVYFLFISLVGIAYYFVYGPIGAPLNWVFAGRLPWYSYLSFTQNLWMAKLNTLGSAILSITWSLGVEEQFYLALPAVIRFVRRSALPYVFIAGIAIAPIVRLFIGYRFQANLYGTYVLLPSRMDSLFLGALCAYYLREPGVWSWLVERCDTMWMVFFMLLAGMAVLGLTGDRRTVLMVSVGYTWIALFYATVLILALTDFRNFLSRAMRWRWLMGLGAIAYTVYLFHFGIYCFCVWLLTGHGWLLASRKDFGVALLAVAITIAFGKLSWRYFERPIMRWGHTWQY